MTESSILIVFSNTTIESYYLCNWIFSLKKIIFIVLLFNFTEKYGRSPTKVINWVKTLKGWQCELAYRLLIKEKLDNGDINEIVSMLKEEKQFENKIFPNIGISINGESIILLSIDSIENIEHLSPRNALKFAEKG